MNFFRCLQDKATFEELQHRLTYTPYSRAEFVRALEILSSRVDLAWAFFVAQNQSFGGFGGAAESDLGAQRTCDTNTKKWQMRKISLHLFAERLSYVHIEQRDALECIQTYDNLEAVFYLDPPYHPETRASREYSDDVTHELVELLLRCKGAVVLSCYYHPVFDPLVEAGWERRDFETACHAAVRTKNSKLHGEGSARALVPRVETVLRNKQALELCSSLFV